jgi:rod shape-determining protein MreB
MVALITSENKVLAVGRAAELMTGRLPRGVEMKYPVESGGISNFRAAEALLKFFAEKLVGNNRLWKANCVIGIPSDISSVEQRAIVQALTSSGIGSINLLTSSFAAALGSDLPVQVHKEILFLLIGAGVTEAAVISLNGIVAVKTVRTGSDGDKYSDHGFCKEQI